MPKEHKIRISVVINTLNEEKVIRDCIEAIKNDADEIVVVDMHSEDRTLEICREYTQNIYFHEPLGCVEPARNFAISKASHDWILRLDADERVPPKLIPKLKEIATTEDDLGAVFVPFKHYFFGKRVMHCGYENAPVIMFFRKENVTYHPQIHKTPEIRGKTITLPPDDDLCVKHFSHRTISDFLVKADRYSTFEAEALRQKGTSFRKRMLLLAPFREFFKRYWKKKGYKDGSHGFIVCLLLAYYHLLIHCKLWEFEKDERQAS